MKSFHCELKEIFGLFSLHLVFFVLVRSYFMFQDENSIRFVLFVAAVLYIWVSTVL